MMHRIRMQTCEHLTQAKGLLTFRVPPPQNVGRPAGSFTGEYWIDRGRAPLPLVGQQLYKSPAKHASRSRMMPVFFRIQCATMTARTRRARKTHCEPGKTSKASQAFSSHVSLLSVIGRVPFRPVEDDDDDDSAFAKPVDDDDEDDDRAFAKPVDDDEDDDRAFAKPVDDDDDDEDDMLSDVVFSVSTGRQSSVQRYKVGLLLQRRGVSLCFCSLPFTAK
jgi:hypothetical protein